MTDIRFRIRENRQLAMFDIDDAEGVRSSGVYERLRGQGVSDRLARQWIAEHGPEYVGDKLDFVAGQGGVASPVKYLSAAITRDFGAAPAPAAPPDPETVVALEARRAEAAARDAEDAARAAARAERGRRLACVEAALARRNPTQRDAARRLFAERLEGEMERADFARNGWSSALNAAAVFAFWEEMEPGLFEAE